MVTYKDEGDVIEITLPHEAQEMLDAIALVKSKLLQFRSNPETVDLEGDKEFREAVELAQTWDDSIFLSSHLEDIASDPSRTNEILDDIFFELEDAESSLNRIIDDEPDISIPQSDLTEWKPVIFTGKAIIKTPAQTIEIMPSDVEWETENGSDNNPKGADVQHTGIYCFDGGEITWRVYRYLETTLQSGDVGTKSDIEVETRGGELVQDFASWELDPDPAYDAI